MNLKKIDVALGKTADQVSRKRHPGLYDNVRGPSGGSIFEAMNLVNTARIDAHAKDIGDSEYDTLLEALDTLENVFAPP